MNRRDLLLGALGDLRIMMLPNGRVRVEPAGMLAAPDCDAPIEEYPSLRAMLAARLKRRAP
jgi:hypothetical protein